ncbi:hypothetical protein Bca4012_041989 [Brassica carinata]|uniref:Uncharacterized protein n=2 Tax=Brassica TaxID=3705 RepID=A0A3P6DZ01_BRAOL|nr:unnamed protein product [Brassica napus]VDD29131.1 unnamed protein product [Brassica oleracea]
MNSATKFLVMILFIGVLCTDVGARKLDKVSKEIMDQKSFMFPPMPSTLPTPVVPPVPLPEPISGLGEAVSATKDTKLGISIPKTAATNGVGTELVIIVKSSARKVKNAKDDAASGPGGPGSRATGSTIVETSGTVTVDGPNPSAYSKSIADRQAGADAQAGPDGAKSNGSSSGYAYTNAGGSTSNSNPWTINNSPQNQQSLLYS